MTTEEKGIRTTAYYTLLEFPSGDNGDYNIKELHFDTAELAIDYAIRNGILRYQVLETRVVASSWED